ncbi:hypothetical protein HZF05_13545 [Sphingomonas sp. CGMCC 1.13654]|uniref:MFS transporter n=1 Tax=Sphingomonas chungangi TaxID=2683589 RepID=A0A838LAG6_9SPHN|nr:multidrug efflux MFS transporter [Sphingomonas chungangi]MBA2935116.1 hypothetical protein [Sphingomonas chungangi]MVW55337.1 hypothetical protein [Sphingomonas chungangi]
MSRIEESVDDASAATMTTAALPALSLNLHASEAASAWLVSGYLLALATGVPMSAWD